MRIPGLGALILPILEKMAANGRKIPAGASEQDKMILQYLRDKVDPVFVPLMRTLIQKR